MAELDIDYQIKLTTDKIVNDLVARFDAGSANEYINRTATSLKIDPKEIADKVIDEMVARLSNLLTP